jgi:hypothetical protein
LTEFQGRDWNATQGSISDGLTVRSYDRDGHPIGGRFEAGTPLSDVLAAIRASMIATMTWQRTSY